MRVDLADFAKFLGCFRAGGLDPACGELPAPNLRPDERVHLSIKALTVSPPQPVPGEVVDVSISIHNDSEVINVNAAVLELTLDDLKIAATRTDIAALGTVVVHFMWIPKKLGLHALTASVDPAGEFVDQNRLNNLLAVDIVVAGAPPTGSDFAIESIEPPQILGGYRGIKVIVRNNGLVASSAPWRKSVLRRDESGHCLRCHQRERVVTCLFPPKCLGGHRHRSRS